MSQIPSLHPSRSLQALLSGAAKAGMKGTLAAFWREGDWDAVAGAFFYEFDYDRHVVSFGPKHKLWRKARDRFQ